MKPGKTHANRGRRHPSRFISLGAMALFMLTAGVATAGTICGTIRDGTTNGPVARAGVFVRTPDGTYTGYYGASDENGGFCIGAVPAGTYDLEVRVDNYAVGYFRNVTVTDDVTAVDLEVTESEFYFAPPWPNPAQGGVSFRFRSGETRPIRLMIHDLAGRLIRSWQDTAGSSGERSFTWNLCDRNGARVPSGVYFARLALGDMIMGRVFVVLE